MHTTLCKDVKGYMDTNQKGWCFHITQLVRPLRFKNKDSIKEILLEERPDLVRFYNNPEIAMCGWSHTETSGELQMNINNEWVTIFLIKPPDILVNINNSLPSFIVIDNFYSEPDKIRNFALKQEFFPDLKRHKGKRSATFRFEGLKERFEVLLGRNIHHWEKYGTNGCFQYCIAEDLPVYHHDMQQYAGVLFLTPDAPIKSGTQFFRSRHTKKMKVPSEDHSTVFRNGFYDSTEFESVDTVGNVYNRLVLFDAQLIHAAPVYFGNSKENGRLFQLFFFDLD
jgi:hypothetical protein